MLREHARFQLEASKLGRNVVFQVTVLEKRERRRTRLYAETQCHDPYNFLLQFVIRDAQTFDEVVDKFVAQLLYRGFAPVRYRVRELNDDKAYSKWGAWTLLDVPLDEDPAVN